MFWWLQQPRFLSLKHVKVAKFLDLHLGWLHVINMRSVCLQMPWMSLLQFFPLKKTENTLHPLQSSIWTHQTQDSGKQPEEAGWLTAVALVRGIHSEVSMGTALLAFAGSPELARCTKRKIGGEKERSRKRFWGFLRHLGEPSTGCVSFSSTPRGPFGSSTVWTGEACT